METINTKQLAAMVENFPSLLSELSEQESAGGQLFSLAKGGGGRTECVCVCWGEGGVGSKDNLQSTQ